MSVKISKKGLLRTTVLAAALSMAYANVSATPVAYTPHDMNMDPGSWVVDRADGSVFEHVTFDGRDALRLGIAPPAEGGSFYNWQGYSQRTAAAAGESFLRGDLWINDDWNSGGTTTDFVNTGMWGSAMPEETVAGGAYVDAKAVFPIIHFTNEQDATGNPDGIGMLRIWDTTVNPSGWIYLPETAGLINYGGWNSLDMRLIPEDNKIEYYFNGTLVHTWVDPTASDDSTPGQFYAMYLKARNNGVTTFDTYWSRLLAGTVYSDGNVSGTITGDVLIDAGASVNVSDGTTISGSLVGNGDATASTTVQFDKNASIAGDVFGTNTGFSFSADSEAVATIGRDLVLEGKSAASGGSQDNRVQVTRNIDLSDSLLSGYWSVGGQVLAKNGTRIEDANILANGSREEKVLVSGSGTEATIKNSTLTSETNGLGTGDLVKIVSVRDHARLDIEGSSVVASGSEFTRAIYADNGAEITATGTSASTSGTDSHVVHAFGQSTDTKSPVITLNGGTVTAEGYMSWGLYAQNGGQIVSSADIVTEGDGGFGVFAGRWSGGETKIILNGGSVTTKGSNTLSEDKGDGSHGVLSIGAGASVDVNNTKVTIEADHSEEGQASALWAQDEGVITASGATINTKGNWTFGAFAVGPGSKIDIRSATSVATEKEGSSAVFARNGGQIDVSDAQLTTHGKWARGLYARGADAKVTATNVTVDTSGVEGMGVYARDGGNVSVTNSVITTSGASGHGAYVRNESAATITDTSISATGVNASALYTFADTATTGGGEVIVTNSQLKTTGADAHGVVLMGGSLLNMTGGSITATGSGSAGMRVHNQSSATLNGVTVISAGPSLISSFSNPNRSQTINIGSGSDLTQNNGTLLLVSRETENGADGIVALNLKSGSFAAGNVLDADGSKQVTVTKASDAYWAGIVIDQTTTVVPEGSSQDYSDDEIDGSVASGTGSTVTFNSGANVTGSVSSGTNATTTFNGTTNIGGDVAGQQGSSATFGGATTIGGSVAGAPSTSFAFSGPSTSIAGSVAGLTGSTFSFSGPTTIGGNVAGDGASFNFGQGAPTTITGNVGLNNGSIIKGGVISLPILITGNVDMDNASILSGNLNIAGMVSGSGTLGPGNSIGVQTYGSLGAFTGDYVAEVNAAGQSDLIKIASGDADLRGINLVVDQENGTGGYKLNHDYTIVETAKADGISAVAGNQFASEALGESFAGTLVKLDAAKFGANTVQISLSADNSAIDAIRKDLSRNQNATLDGVLSVQGQNASADAALQSTDPKGALNQLSGELHGSTQTALLNNSQLVTRTLSNRMRANLGAGMQAGAPTAQASGAVAGSMPTSNAYPLWAQVVGSWTELDDDGNAAKAKSDTAGLFIGADTSVGKGWRVGAALGFTDGDVKVNDRNSKSDVTSYTAALYGGNSWQTAKGQVNFLAGAAYTNNEVDSRRTVNVGGSQTLKADYDVNTTQLFTELGYAIPVGQASVVEPYLGLAWMSQKAKGFDESGGSAALHGDSQTDDVTTFTLGLRGSTTITTGKSEARLMAGLGWRHASGDVDASRSLSFIEGAGQAFRVAGAPIAENAAVVDLGAEMNVGKNTALGLSYNGQFGNGASDNAGSVYLRVRF